MAGLGPPLFTAVPGSGLNDYARQSLGRPDVRRDSQAESGNEVAGRQSRLNPHNRFSRYVLIRAFPFMTCSKHQNEPQLCDAPSSRSLPIGELCRLVLPRGSNAVRTGCCEVH